MNVERMMKRRNERRTGFDENRDDRMMRVVVGGPFVVVAGKRLSRAPLLTPFPDRGRVRRQ